MSQHLKVLKDAGLVCDRAVGTRRIYHLDPDGMRALRSQLDRFWGDALANYRTLVDEANGDVMAEQYNAPIERQIVVEAPVEQAFSLFVERFDAIKPREHNLLAVPIVETVFEPRVGGAVYDRGADGSECQWARVLVYEPPHRLVFSWDINGRWQIESDPEKTSEVEVRFVAESEHRTRVELEHRNIDRHGDGWEAVRDGVGDDAGWTLYLTRYGDVVKEGTL